MTKIRAYRMVKRKWSDQAFDGDGAKRTGGCWNSKGRSCVYLTESISLAHLEVMVHLDDYSVLPNYVIFELQLPVSMVMQLSSDALPSDWREDPAPFSTAEIGDEWLASNESAVLSVPSAIIPREDVYLLNPQHPQFKTIIKSAKVVDIAVDQRL